MTVAPYQWILENKKLSGKSVFVYGKTESLQKVLEQAGIKSQRFTRFPVIGAAQRVIIAPDSIDHNLIEQKDDISKFIQAGGRILVLEHGFNVSWDWLSVGLKRAHREDNPVSRVPFYSRDYVNLRDSQHPVFSGLDREDFRWWNAQGSNPYLITDHGFEHNDAVTVLADHYMSYLYDGIEAIPPLPVVLEADSGEGKYIISLLEVTSRNRHDTDPIASRFFFNLIEYFLQMLV